jgi:hypothetical protein
VFQALRAASYTLAVLCGHSHPESAGAKTLLMAYMEKHATVKDFQELMGILVGHLETATDEGVCASLVLTLQNVLRADDSYIPMVPMRVGVIAQVINNNNNNFFCSEWS